MAIFPGLVKPQIEVPDGGKNIPVGDGSPVITTVGYNVTALANTTITIQCPNSGVPTPTVTWRKDGQGVADGEDYEIQGDGSLVIRRALRKDDGLYTCSVESVAGTDSASSSVTVVGRLFLNVQIFRSLEVKEIFAVVK